MAAGIVAAASFTQLGRRRSSKRARWLGNLRAISRKAHESKGSSEPAQLVGPHRRGLVAAAGAEIVSILTAQAVDAKEAEQAGVISRITGLDLQDMEFPIWESGIESAEVAAAASSGGVEGSQLGQPGKDWPGLWRVVYAPHIRTGGGAGLSRFDVYYDIGDDGRVFRSFVRFESPIGRGWLNASGIIEELTGSGMDVPGLGRRPASEVVFNKYWVDMDAALPRPAADESDEVLSQLGAPFFFQDLSRFPTLLFDKAAGVTVFRFPPLGVEIAARRVGPSGTNPRELRKS